MFFRSPLLTVEFIVDPGTDFDHCDGIQSLILSFYNLMGIGKPAVKKHIFRSVTGLYRFVNQLDHDIRSFALRHDSSLSCKGPLVVFLYLSQYVFFF